MHHKSQHNLVAILELCDRPWGEGVYDTRGGGVGQNMIMMRCKGDGGTKKNLYGTGGDRIICGVDMSK